MLEMSSSIVHGSGMLNVGIGTRMQFQLSGQEAKFKGTGVMIGMVPGEFLIIRVPAIPGILSRLGEGDPIVVRYVYAGNVYGFTTTILTSIRKPSLIILVSYPDVIETLNLRKTRRMECCFPATVATRGGVYKAVIVDISTGGCRIRFDTGTIGALALDVDQIVKVSFHLAGVTKEQVINGKIKSLKQDTQLCEIGTQFDQENETVLGEIKHYIESVITDFSLG